MELGQLKIYLRGAIDLETAILTGERAICEIDEQIESIQALKLVIPDPPLPAMPVLQLSEKEPEEPQFHKATVMETALSPYGWHLGFSIYWSLCGVALATKWGFWGAIVGIIACFVVADLVLAIPFTIKENRERKNAHKQALEKHQQTLQYRKDAQERHRIKLAEWEKEYYRIGEAHNLMVSAYKLLQQHKQEKCEQMRQQRIKLDVKLDELREKLWDYYNSGPIYQSYRNLVAVTQIYEYLASGIASELEGPNGAYAQYMNDVRAERICNDLEKIRTDMNNGFKRMSANQQMLCGELKSVNRVLGEVNRSCYNLTNGMAVTTRQLNMLAISANQMRQDVSADIKRLHEGLSNISEDTRMIALNSATMGLNQYLDMKSRGVDAYYTTFLAYVEYSGNGVKARGFIPEGVLE